MLSTLRIYYAITQKKLQGGTHDASGCRVVRFRPPFEGLVGTFRILLVERSE